MMLDEQKKTNLKCSENPDVPEILQVNNQNLFDESSYNKNLPTKIYSHGYSSDPKTAYPSRDGRPL